MVVEVVVAEVVVVVEVDAPGEKYSVEVLEIL